MDGIDPKLLDGKVVWVTASARGLGRAIAERLARCGASIVVHGRSEKTTSEFDEAPRPVTWLKKSLLPEIPYSLTYPILTKSRRPSRK